VAGPIAAHVAHPIPAAAEITTTVPPTARNPNATALFRATSKAKLNPTVITPSSGSMNAVTVCKTSKWKRPTAGSLIDARVHPVLPILRAHPLPLQNPGPPHLRLRSPSHRLRRPLQNRRPPSLPVRVWSTPQLSACPNPRKNRGRSVSDYLPMQNEENTTSRISSISVFPTTSPNAPRASRRSRATNSGAAPTASASMPALRWTRTFSKQC